MLSIKSLWFKDKDNFKLLKFFVLSRFSMTFLCKTNKAFKNIIPIDLRTKMLTQCDEIKHCVSYGNRIDNHSRFKIWWPYLYFNIDFRNDQTLLLQALYIIWFSDVHTTDSSNMTEFGVFLADFWWLKQGAMWAQNVLRRNWTPITFESFEWRSSPLRWLQPLPICFVT